MESERESIRSHFLVNSIWNILKTCLETDYMLLLLLTMMMIYLWINSIIKTNIRTH